MPITKFQLMNPTLYYSGSLLLFFRVQLLSSVTFRSTVGRLEAFLGLYPDKMGSTSTPRAAVHPVTLQNRY